MAATHLSDEEVADICRPLTQPAAQVRFLRTLQLAVQRRPDGSPLVRRADWDRITNPTSKPANGPRWSTN